MWTAWAFPFVVLAILVATGPVIYMTHHSIRFGHHPSPPDGGRVRERADPEGFGWTVCSHCKAVVIDSAEHMQAVHQYADT